MNDNHFSLILELIPSIMFCNMCVVHDRDALSYFTDDPGLKNKFGGNEVM